MNILTLDFETAYGKHPSGVNYSLRSMTTERYIRHELFKIHGVGVKLNRGETEYVYKPRDVGECLYSYDWSDTALLCHNTMFDGAILGWHFDIHPALLLDTLSMGRALFPHEKHSLEYLLERLGLPPKGKELALFSGKWDLNDEEQAVMGRYCMNDVDRTLDLLDVMKVDFPIEELKLIDITLRMFTNPQLELDKNVLTKHLAEVRQKRADLMDKVSHGVTSIRSNQQFAELLKAHGVEPPMKISKTTEKETYAFAKTDEGMQALLDHPKEEVRTLAEVRLGVKSSIEETRTEMFLGIAERGPLPIALNYCGAKNTTRWSGGDKQNLQNLPRGGALRHSIVAPEGYQLGVADLSAIEARMLAWLAGETELLDVFRSGECVYCSFASDA